MFRGEIRNISGDDFKAIEDIFGLYWPNNEFRSHLLERIKSVFNGSPDSVKQGFKYFVAENNSEVVGVIGFRNAPDHMLSFTKTGKSLELYTLAVKNRGDGAGRALVEKMFETAKVLGYTEVVLFNPDSLETSWGFYDHLGFQRIGSAIAPNGEAGHMWQMLL